MYRTPTYKAWQNMLARCRNPKHPRYVDYGGRGIAVCERWLKFENFFADMGQRPDGKTLERQDNDAGYCPDNCRWKNAQAQARNRRRSCFLTHNGLTLPVVEWASRSGVTYRALYSRLKRGWTPERALGDSRD